MNQIAETSDKVFYLESEDDYEKAKEFQTIIIKSGNVDLFMKILTQVSDRIVFVKNIETIDQDISAELVKHPFVVSGDLEVNPKQNKWLTYQYAGMILFSPTINAALPALVKYQALFITSGSDQIIALSYLYG